MSDSESNLPSRWGKSGGTVHRHRIALVTSVAGSNITGNVITNPGDTGGGSTISGVQLFRGVEFKGFVMPSLYYPVQKRNNQWHLTGGGCWSGIGTKAGDGVNIGGAFVPLAMPPWVNDWNALPAGSLVGVGWDEVLQAGFPIVAKCT